MLIKAREPETCPWIDSLPKGLAGIAFFFLIRWLTDTVGSSVAANTLPVCSGWFCDFHRLQLNGGGTSFICNILFPSCNKILVNHVTNAEIGQI